MTIPDPSWSWRLGLHAEFLDATGHDTAGFTLTIDDEGSPLATGATSIDFVGSGVTASGTGAAKTVTIPGGATSSDTSMWRPLGDGAGGFVFDGTTYEVVMAFS